MGIIPGCVQDGAGRKNRVTTASRVDMRVVHVFLPTRQARKLSPKVVKV